MQEDVIKEAEWEKLIEAKEMLANNLETPPSLTELSKQNSDRSYLETM